MKELYSKEDVKIMKNIDESYLKGESRIYEIKKFAELQGYKKIGIANCISMNKEAEKLKEIFSDKFEVYTINCKENSIPEAEFFDDPNAKGIICNPKGQAKYLQEKGTELNIVLGLCHGHDMLFNMYSKVPTTTLVVKDKKHKHNPILELRD
ncbi:MAG TPA: DUF1847 domain-containing protein [Ignavibacteriales bacterium]|nr:DUF1847 domain-containing protein [Ignavibacteriales bacterium]